jgi:UDP-GlcNAc:undecaprenyl-phosphate GlcNAc-1-phosphate transferase
MISSLHALVLLGGGLLISTLAIPPVRRLAWRLDLVDRPLDGRHKSHARPMPYGGGIAIWLGTVSTALPALFWLFPPALLRPTLVLLACATALFLTGLIDDRRGLSPLSRFLVQLGAAFALVACCPGFRLALSSAPAVSVPLTVLWILSLTNAFNFLDNMDGLSAGTAAVALILLAIMGLLAHQLLCLLICLILLGAVAGFLAYNFPPASIFMGDAGGLFIGFLAGSVAALLSNQLGQAHAALPYRVAPLLALSVPLYDLVSVSFIRLKNGVPPWVGDRNHISHRLVDLGLSRRATVLVIHGATLLTGLPALLILRISAPTAWLLFLLLPLAAGLVAALDAAARRRATA